MPPRTVALVAAVCVTIGWLLAATLTPPVARLQSLPEPPSRTIADEPQFIERLNLKLREVPPPPTTERNPFSFGSKAPRATTGGRVAPAAREDEPVAGDMPQPFAYSLSGIGIAGQRRTAVLTDGQNVRIVALDDVVGEYRVSEITDSSVTLVSDTARQTLRLAQ